MGSFQLKEKWRELGGSKLLCCGWLPKVDLIPRTLLAQITVPIEISYRDCTLGHRGRLKTKAPKSTIIKVCGPGWPLQGDDVATSWRVIQRLQVGLVIETRSLPNSLIGTVATYVDHSHGPMLAPAT